MKFFNILLCFLRIAFGSEEDKKTYIVEDNKSKYQIEVDESSHKIRIISLGKTLHKPKDMSITLYKNLNNEQTINLEAVDLSSNRPEFQGNLGPNEGSFIGFQLKFTMPKDGLKVLKYMPKIPSRQR